MELRTSDVMNIVNNNHAKVREQQQMNDYLAEKNRYVKKSQTVERIKRSAVRLGIGVVLGAAPTASAINDGHNEIVMQFDDATSEYGVRKYSSGEYYINHGNTYVDFEDGINGMINDARDKGMNDVEIAIGLNTVIDDSITKGFIDTSLLDRCHQCIDRHAQKELSGEYRNGK